MTAAGWGVERHNTIRMARQRILAVLFFVSLFVIFFLPHADNDFGWHYRCGEKILQGRSICTGGDFLYFLSDYKWANPTFLYDAFIAAIFDHLGFLGISLFGALLFTLIMVPIYRSSRAGILITISLMYVAILLSSSVLYLGFRSQTLSLLFGVLTYSLLANRGSVRLKKIFWLIPLGIVWANSHGSFFLGPLMMAAYTIDQWLNYFRRRLSLRTALAVSAIFLTMLFATSLNPFGWRIYEEVYRHWHTPLNTLIAEWVPPSFWQEMMIIASAGVFAVYAAFKNRATFFELIILAMTVFFALHARRNLPFFYFYYLYLVLKNFHWDVPKRYLATVEYLSIAFLMLTLASYAPGKIKNTVSFSVDFSHYCADGYVKYPCRAAEFLEKFFSDRQTTLNIFNTYEWGGFLVWRLPTHRIFVDGRTPAWRGENGQSPYAYWLEILQTKKDWDKKLDFYRTDCLFIGAGTFLDVLLQERGDRFGYREIYRDRMAAVWMKY